MKASNVRGHCQACGRIQVVLADTAQKGMMSSHGYRVQSGYFQGVCIGHNHLPLEVSREYLDWVVEDLGRYALAQTMRAERLQSGADLLKQVPARHPWGAVKYAPKASWRDPSVVIIVNWHDASTDEQRLGLEEVVGSLESDARFARSHAASLLRLAFEVHGKPLIDRDEEIRQAQRVRAEKKAPIEGAYRTKQAQKNDLENLNRQYSKLRSQVLDRYLGEPDREYGDAGSTIYDIPHDLVHWREKHSTLVLQVYPDMNDIVNQIRGLVVAREEIKSRPVIK